MDVLNLNASTVIANDEDFIRKFSLRSHNLWKLFKASEALGYVVPKSILIDCSLSQELYQMVGKSLPMVINEKQYTLSSAERIQKYSEYLSAHHHDLIDISTGIDHGKAPIIRGTSCAEGFKGLSFAGVCHSWIPKRDLDIDTNTFNGTAKVLSSVFSPYAQYYFRTHGVPASVIDVGIIMMEMISDPLFHVTAYVYPSEIRIKYFFTPQTGTVYKGGGDIVVTIENEEQVLECEFGEYAPVWHQTIRILRELPQSIYGTDYPVDVEFLISKTGDDCRINIVQIRPLSQVHFGNYSRNKSTPLTALSGNSSIIVPEAHLYHSFGNFIGEINIVDSEIKNQQSLIQQIYVVKHDSGNGLFSFLNNLPTDDRRVGLIVTHPKERTHDHLQYSVYEDPRLLFVTHMEDKFASELKDAMIAHVMSNGQITSIDEVAEMTFGNLHVNFITKDMPLPERKSISAVFLVGFIDGQIIAARNERGWDVPGGHVEPNDLDIFATLQREATEESGVTVKTAVPYALLRFEGREDQMLFYASNECTFGEFTPSSDAFERKLMTTDEFISLYHWKKDVMELLIKRAVESLKS